MLANEDTVLRSDKGVLLVPYTRSHVPTYHTWMASKELQELTASEPLTLDEEYAMQASWQKDADKLTFIIVDGEAYAASGQKDDVACMVGDVNCFFNDPEDALDRVEIEVMVAEERNRRKGFASEALELRMWYCVRELGVKGFRAQILERNEGSRRLFERLGFQMTKRIPCFGEVVYELRGVSDRPVTGHQDGQQGGDSSAWERVVGKEGVVVEAYGAR
jgi:RimJ/RimL family protein N-acetyltransferase